MLGEVWYLLTKVEVAPLLCNHMWPNTTYMTYLLGLRSAVRFSLKFAGCRKRVHSIRRTWTADLYIDSPSVEILYSRPCKFLALRMRKAQLLQDLLHKINAGLQHTAVYCQRGRVQHAYDLDLQLRNLWCHVNKTMNTRDAPSCWCIPRISYQSSNPIGQFIIHIYMGICTIALTTP